MGAARVPGRPSVCHHSRLAQAEPQGAHRIPGAAGELATERSIFQASEELPLLGDQLLLPPPDADASPTCLPLSMRNLTCLAGNCSGQLHECSVMSNSL